MFLKRFFTASLLLATTIALLVSCESRTDQAKKQITPEKIKQALVNRVLPGSGGDFHIELPGSVELIETAQDGGTATALIILKALNLSNKAGVEGRLKLNYRYESSGWQFNDLEVLSLEAMNEEYAKRLIELADFPLHFAANLGDLKQVRKALKNQVPVNGPERGKESTAVMFAAERGRFDIVELLIANGADVTHSNKNGLTALHVAAYGNFMDIVQLLVDKGADVNAKDNAGKTPLYFAALNDAIDVAEYLVARDADINAYGKNARPPIFAAAKNNSVAVAKFLLETGAEVNIKSAEEHYSPLLSAAYYNSVELVDLLLEAGADTTAQLSSFHRAKTEYTALELAEKKGHQQVVDLLRKTAQ